MRRLASACRARAGVRRGRLVDALVGDPVLRHERVAHGPELRRVHGMGRAVALGVVLAVAAALAGAEPGHRGALLRVLAPRRLQHRARHGGPLHAVGRAGHPPVVRGEPGLGRPGHHRGGAELVDPEIVPVDQEDEVREAKAPGRVARLVTGARGQAPLALDGEDPHVLAAGELEGQRLARGGRHAVAGRARVELQEEGLAFHLGVPRQAAAVPQARQVLPCERPAALVGEGEPRVAGPLVARPERLVEDSQGGIHERDRVPGREHEPVREGEPGAPDVPAHGAREEQREEEVHLGSAAAGMPRLTVVQGKVDHLVDQVLHELPVGELALGLRVQLVDLGQPASVGHGRTASLPTNGPIRSIALRMFACEFA